MSNQVRQTPLSCSGHTRPVVHLSFSKLCSDGYFLISACKDGKPMLRQGDTGDWIGTFEGHKGAVWGVALNDTATLAGTGAADFSAKVWDAQKGEELHSFAHRHIVKSVDFSPNSDHLLTGSNEKLLRIFDLNKPQADPVQLSGHTGNIKHNMYSKCGVYIYSSSDDNTVRCWDTRTNQEVHSLSLSAPAGDLHLSEAGDLLTVAYGSTVAFYRTDSWREEKSVSLPTIVNTAGLHPDSTMFVAGGEDFKLYKYDFQTMEEIDNSKGHFGPVHTVRFSPDGELYASGSEDGTLRLWQTTVGKTYGLWKCVEGEEGGEAQGAAV